MNNNTSQVPLPLSWIQLIDFPHKLGICDKLFGKTLSAKGICWIKTGAGLVWKLDLTNPTHRWIVYGKYEGDAFINWARDFLPSDGVFIDSGANVGQMLLYLSQFLPQGKVLAFEPGKSAADWLEECLMLHKNLPVEMIRAGLGKSKTTLRLKNVGESFGHGAWNQVSEDEGEEIQIVSLGDELRKRSIEKVSLWKLDVEGYEIPALQGAENYIKNKNIKAIYAEMHGVNGQNIRNYLQEFGYKCYLFQNNNLYIPQSFPNHTNGLFLPS